MADKQRRPRAAAPIASTRPGGAQEQGPVRPPMDNGIFALLRRGNQAMNERVAASRGGRAEQAAVEAPALPGAAPMPTYQEVWEDVQDMIEHGAFSFRQLVGIIDQQADLSPEQRLRMKEDARRQVQAVRGGQGG